MHKHTLERSGGQFRQILPTIMLQHLLQALTWFSRFFTSNTYNNYLDCFLTSSLPHSAPLFLCLILLKFIQTCCNLCMKTKLMDIRYNNMRYKYPFKVIPLFSLWENMKKGTKMIDFGPKSREWWGDEAWSYMVYM